MVNDQGIVKVSDFGLSRSGSHVCVTFLSQFYISSLLCTSVFLPHHSPALLFLCFLPAFIYLAQSSASPLSNIPFLLPSSPFPFLPLLSPASNLLAAATSHIPVLPLAMLCHWSPSPASTNTCLFAKGHFRPLKPRQSTNSESRRFLLGSIGCMQTSETGDGCPDPVCLLQIRSRR